MSAKPLMEQVHSLDTVAKKMTSGCYSSEAISINNISRACITCNKIILYTSFKQKRVPVKQSAKAIVEAR